MINKSRITCKCHGVSGSCSIITCWQQLTSIREIGKDLTPISIIHQISPLITFELKIPFFLIFVYIHVGDYLREKYDEATQVKLNKRGHLQVKDISYKVPTATDLVYLDESPDWCRNTKQLQWPGMYEIYRKQIQTSLHVFSFFFLSRSKNPHFAFPFFLCV